MAPTNAVTSPAGREVCTCAEFESDGILRDILLELQRIRQAIEGQQRPVASLSRADRLMLARLLPAIAGALGSEQFTSRDLVEDDRPAVRLVARGLSVKQISKLFARADGIPINGLMVQRQGVEFQVTVWQIVAC